MEPSNPHLTTRLTLTRELNNLKDSVLVIGDDCCQIIALMISSFSVSSNFMEDKVLEIYKKVQKETDELENQCFAILSLQQPLLKDLRLVVGALRISNYLVRIASYSKRLINISSLIENKNCIPSELQTIAESCQLMLQDVLRSFQSGSIDLALQLIKKDKDIDLLHDSSFQKIIKRMTQEDPALVTIDAQLLTSVRFLERTGDVIAAIAKEVYFVYTGQKFHINN